MDEIISLPNILSFDLASDVNKSLNVLHIESIKHIEDIHANFLHNFLTTLFVLSLHQFENNPFKGKTGNEQDPAIQNISIYHKQHVSNPNSSRIIIILGTNLQIGEIKALAIDIYYMESLPNVYTKVSVEEDLKMDLAQLIPYSSLGKHRLSLKHIIYELHFAEEANTLQLQQVSEHSFDVLYPEDFFIPNGNHCELELWMINEIEHIYDNFDKFRTNLKSNEEIHMEYASNTLNVAGRVLGVLLNLKNGQEKIYLRQIMDNSKNRLEFQMNIYFETSYVIKLIISQGSEHNTSHLFIKYHAKKSIENQKRRRARGWDSFLGSVKDKASNVGKNVATGFNDVVKKVEDAGKTVVDTGKQLLKKGEDLLESEFLALMDQFSSFEGSLTELVESKFQKLGFLDIVNEFQSFVNITTNGINQIERNVSNSVQSLVNSTEQINVIEQVQTAIGKVNEEIENVLQEVEDGLNSTEALLVEGYTSCSNALMEGINSVNASLSSVLEDLTSGTGNLLGEAQSMVEKTTSEMMKQFDEFEFDKLESKFLKNTDILSTQISNRFDKMKREFGSMLLQLPQEILDKALREVKIGTTTMSDIFGDIFKQSHQGMGRIIPQIKSKDTIAVESNEKTYSNRNLKQLVDKMANIENLAANLFAELGTNKMKTLSSPILASTFEDKSKESAMYSTILTKYGHENLNKVRQVPDEILSCFEKTNQIKQFSQLCQLSAIPSDRAVILPVETLECLADVGTSYLRRYSVFQPIMNNLFKSGTYLSLEILMKNELLQANDVVATVNELSQEVGTESAGTGDINGLFGRLYQADYVIFNCQMSKLALRGGKSAILPDVIQIPNQPDCDYSLEMAILGDTNVINEAINGRFVYKIFEIKGQISISLADQSSKDDEARIDHIFKVKSQIEDINHFEISQESITLRSQEGYMSITGFKHFLEIQFMNDVSLIVEDMKATLSVEAPEISSFDIAIQYIDFYLKHQLNVTASTINGESLHITNETVTINRNENSAVKFSLVHSLNSLSNTVKLVATSENENWFIIHPSKTNTVKSVGDFKINDVSIYPQASLDENKFEKFNIVDLRWVKMGLKKLGDYELHVEIIEETLTALNGENLIIALHALSTNEKINIFIGQITIVDGMLEQVFQKLVILNYDLSLIIRSTSQHETNHEEHHIFSLVPLPHEILVENNGLLIINHAKYERYTSFILENYELSEPIYEQHGLNLLIRQQQHEAEDDDDDQKQYESIQIAIVDYFRYEKAQLFSFIFKDGAKIKLSDLLTNQTLITVVNESIA